MQTGDNEMDIKKIDSEGMQSINQAYKRGKVVHTYQYSTDPWAATEGRGFFDHLINCHIFNSALAPCRQLIRQKIDVPQIPLHVFTELKMSLKIVWFFFY